MTLFETVQLISSIVVIGSAAVAGIWTVFRFRKLREVRKALTIKIVPKVHTAPDTTVLEIFVELTNTGTVPIFGDAKSNRKCLLHVRKLSVASEGSGSIHWDDPALEPLVQPVQYLRYWETEFVLEPGTPCEVQGYALISTDYRGLLLLQAEFVDPDDVWWTDWMIVDTRIDGSLG